jgi:glycosyltransferase involved in cell wall biosynthesis
VRSNPLVSVVMPLYNSHLYVGAAIESILGQTYENFEFIIIDDGSTDGSSAIVSRYAEKDRRITVYDQENRGVIDALNRGCRLAQGKYIARMDSDDISNKARLSKQVVFLEDNPDFCVCGTWIKTTGGISRVWQMPTDPEVLKANLLFGSVLAHPSVMMRRRTMVDNDIFYRHGYDTAEDFDLWIRLSHLQKLGVIPEILLTYRVHPNQVTKRRKEEKDYSGRKLRNEQLAKLGLHPNEGEMNIHESLSQSEFECSACFVEATEAWLRRILSENRITKVYDQKSLQSVIYNYWYMVCMSTTALGFWNWKTYRNSELTRFKPGKITSSLRLAVKCTLAYLK